MDSGTEECIIQVEEENPEEITFPRIQPKPDGTGNEQLHANTGDHQYLCNVCTEAVNRKSDLTRHKYSHGGERPYYCNVCCKGFTRKITLIIQKRLHSGEPPYCCVCVQ